MPPRSPRGDDDTGIPTDMDRWLHSLIKKSRSRARAAGLEHTLTDDYAERLFLDQRKRCVITGLRFSLKSFPNVLVKHPFAPSIHRCRAKKGYVAENVQLVCIAANFGIGQWDEEVFYALADATARYAGWIRSMRSKRLAQLSQSDWIAEHMDRVSAAELIAMALSSDDLARQRRHIAGLRRTLALGSEGLRSAGGKAAQSRKAGN